MKRLWTIVFSLGYLEQSAVHMHTDSNVGRASSHTEYVRIALEWCFQSCWLPRT